MAPKMMIHKQISSSLSGSDDFEVEREKVGEVYNATEPSTESITPSSLLPKVENLLNFFFIQTFLS